MDAPFQIRPATPADVTALVAIERASFSDPWSAHDFRECIVAKVAALVAVRGTEVTGYVVAHAAADEGEILNLAVGAAHQRRGVARALVRDTLVELAARGARTVYLEVRESNAAARRLYEGLGFVVHARRAHYYRRPVESALVLKAAIPAGEPHA
jgi:ribosomal-protein-alanine N-acetyltransferase